MSDSYAGVSTHIVHGLGTKRARELFAMLVLCIIIGVQMFHLVHAVTYIPATRFFVWKEILHRSDCIDSSKGGKRSGNNTQYEDTNPCFCQGALATCYSDIKNSPKTYNLTRRSRVL